jgi:hypothetical protein
LPIFGPCFPKNDQIGAFAYIGEAPGWLALLRLPCLHYGVWWCRGCQGANDEVGLGFFNEKTNLAEEAAGQKFLPND